MDVIYCSKSPAFCYRYLYIDSLRCGRPRRLIKLTANKGCIVFYTTLWVTATIITICCITAPSGVCIGGRLDVFFVFFCGDTKHLVCWLFSDVILAPTLPRSSQITHIKKSPKTNRNRSWYIEQKNENVFTILKTTHQLVHIHPMHNNQQP